MIGARCTDDCDPDLRASPRQACRAKGCCEDVRGAEDAVGRPRSAGHLHEQRRERYPVRAAEPAGRQEPGGCQRRRTAGPDRRTLEGRGRAGARHRRRRHRRWPDALVRTLRREEQPRLARGRSARWCDPGAHRRGQRAQCRARAAARRARAGRQPRRSQPLRSLYLARLARLDDAGDLRQLVRDHPVARLGRDSLRDDSRDAAHSARRAPACEVRHPELHGRCAGPFRRQHARRRDDELQAGVRVSRRRRSTSSSSSGSRRKRRRRWSGR